MAGHLFLLAGAVLALIHGACQLAAPPNALRSLTKTGAVLALAEAGLLAGAPGWAVAGLTLGALGDYCLSRAGQGAFLAGMAAFGLGHLAYAAGLWQGLPPFWPALLPLGLAASTELWLAPHTGALRGPVRAYVLVITLMALAALSHGLAAPTLLLGVGLFLASDMLLAVDLFRLAADPRPRLGLKRLIWALYWLGQALILQASLAAPG